MTSVSGFATKTTPTVADKVLGTDVSDGTTKNFLLSAIVGQPPYQAVPYAATITIDPKLGKVVMVGALTGNITVAAPTSPSNGDVLDICFVQDATGNRTITWNAVFLTASRPTTVTTANGRTVGHFVYADGVWQ